VINDCINVKVSNSTHNSNSIQNPHFHPIFTFTNIGVAFNLCGHLIIISQGYVIVLN